MLGGMRTWTVLMGKGRKPSRRPERRERALTDPPKHPVELGRVFVHETQPSIALHQLWEMEHRGERR